MSGSDASWASTTRCTSGSRSKVGASSRTHGWRTRLSPARTRTATLTSTGRWMSPSTPDRLELLRAHLPLRGEAHRDAIGLDEAAAFATSIGSALHSDTSGRLVAPTTILTRLIITDRPPWYEDLRRGTMFHAGERYI